MKFGKVPGLDKRVSRLVQGTVMVNAEHPKKTFALLDSVFEQGCNTFDTAHGYSGGDNERFMGQWVNSRGLRGQVVIIGKGAHHSQDRRRVTPFDITTDLHDSLARFKFDYIDLYLLHRDDPNVPVGPIVEVLNEHLRAGRIRAFGGSNWAASRIAEANAYAAVHGLTPFVATSPQFSLVEMNEEPWENCLSISGPQGASQRTWYRENKMAVFAWSSLAGGFLSGRVTRRGVHKHTGALYHRCYASEPNLERLERARQLAKEKHATVPQIALAYVLHQPLDVFPLVAAYKREEFEELADVFGLKLTKHELAWLDLTADVRV